MMDSRQVDLELLVLLDLLDSKNLPTRTLGSLTRWLRSSISARNACGTVDKFIGTLAIDRDRLLDIRDFGPVALSRLVEAFSEEIEDWLQARRANAAASVFDKQPDNTRLALIGTCPHCGGEWRIDIKQAEG
jgi:hypothetical protein